MRIRTLLLSVLLCGCTGAEPSPAGLDPDAALDVAARAAPEARGFIDAADRLGPPAGDATEGFSLGDRGLSPGRTRSVAIDLPGHGNGAFRVGIAGDPRRVSVFRRGAEDAPGLARGGSVVYASKSDASASIWLPKGRAIEELVILPKGSHEITYDLDLPRGSELVAVTGHVVEVRDRGVCWLRFAADMAWDGRGQSAPITVEVDGDTTLRVRVEGEGPFVVDPSWQPTFQEMVEPRFQHAATLIEDSGKVLVSGGTVGCPDLTTCALDTAELYDPTCEDGHCPSFAPIAARMMSQRSTHSSTWLKDGRVLLAGGNLAVDVSTAETFDPITQSFTPTASPMAFGRAFHTATRLPSNQVLMLGGCGAAPEIYDPETNDFRLVAAPSCLTDRQHHTASLLPDGRVLLTGGKACANSVLAVASVEIFEPETETFRCLGDALNVARLDHVATLLPSGDVLLTGGRASESSATFFADVEVFRATTETFEPITDMPFPRFAHIAIGVDDGRVVVAGGSISPLAHVFDPATERFTGADKLEDARSFPAGVLLASNRVLVTGGLSGGTLRSAELFFPGTQGEGCASSGECNSGHCVDGVCCESACEGLCVACSRGTKGYGEDGVCEPIQALLDPDRECEKGDHPDQSCSVNGHCDGLGQCEYPCEQEGYVCRDGGCALPCASSVDCVLGYRCTGAGDCVAIESEGDVTIIDSGICIRCDASHKTESTGSASLFLVATCLFGLAARRRRLRRASPRALRVTPQPLAHDHVDLP